jgi:hypothetical protein
MFTQWTTRQFSVRRKAYQPNYPISKVLIAEAHNGDYLPVGWHTPVMAFPSSRQAAPEGGERLSYV